MILKESYPRSRLKRVPNDVDEKYIEMEKIMNSRKINNKFQYLVKWKNISEEEATWEFEEKFDSTELIEDYWGNKHEIGKDEVITVNLVENAQPKHSMITKQSNEEQLYVIQASSFRNFNELIHDLESGHIDDKIYRSNRDTLAYSTNEDTQIISRFTYDIIYNWEFFCKYIQNN